LDGSDLIDRTEQPSATSALCGMILFTIVWSSYRYFSPSRALSIYTFEIFSLRSAL